MVMGLLKGGSPFFGLAGVLLLLLPLRKADWKAPAIAPPPFEAGGSGGLAAVAAAAATTAWVVAFTSVRFVESVPLLLFSAFVASTFVGAAATAFFIIIVVVAAPLLVVLLLCDNNGCLGAAAVSSCGG